LNNNRQPLADTQIWSANKDTRFNNSSLGKGSGNKTKENAMRTLK
jgi:hypothetical protein